LALLEDSRVDPDMPALHIGAHHGQVLHREGDYFGNGVNLAARVASASEAGQFLITPELETAAAGLCPARYVALAPRELKGVAEPVPLVEVGPA
jgi:class 3 adenylate cyclase